MRTATILAAFASLAACASGPQVAADSWEATSQVDPVTGVERCVVTAPDRVFGNSLTRSGRLYPFVEKNSEVGLLVGASSGGAYRVPPGNIVWRVDQNEPHRIQMADTPVIGEPVNYAATAAMTEEQRAVFDNAMKMSAGMTSAIQNGITAAGGEKAEELLAEMKAGQTLLFRAEAAAPNAGIPSARAYDVGQMRDGTSAPIMLDGSFHSALAECDL